MTWTRLANPLLALLTLVAAPVFSSGCDGSSMTGGADVQGPDTDVDIARETTDSETTDLDATGGEATDLDASDDIDTGNLDTDTDTDTDTGDLDTDALDPDALDPDVTDITDITDTDATDTGDLDIDALDPDITDPDITDTTDATDTGDLDTDALDPDITDTDTTDPDITDTDTTDPDITDITDITDTTDTDITDTDTVVAGPFDDLIGLTGDELRLALRDRIDDQSALGYSPGRAREVMFSFIDAYDGRVECVYTGRTVRAENPDAPPVGSASLPNIDTTPGVDCRHPDGSPVAGGCDFNTEHSWPRSQGANNEPAVSDLHHLFSTWDMANNRRGNFPFGDTTCVANGCPWHEGASELGTDTASRTVFEVRPKYRGDIARAQLYFAVRYGLAIPNTTEPTLRAWHLEDPVDAIERTRNDRIDIWQGNRNPFVDIPDFVDAFFDF